MGNSNNKEKEPVKKALTPIELKTYVMVCQTKLTLFSNKKVELIKKKRREIIDCLKQNSLEIAKVKMESIIREEDMITVFEIIGSICEILKEKCTYISSCETCPTDLRAHLDTIAYAAARLEVEDLHTLSKLIGQKFSEIYLSKAKENIDQLVNVNIVEKLKIKPAADSYLIIRLKQLAKECEFEYEFPCEVIEVPQESGNYFPNQNPYGNVFDNYGQGQNQFQNQGQGQMAGFNQYYNQGQNQSNPYDFNNQMNQQQFSNPQQPHFVPNDFNPNKDQKMTERSYDPNEPGSAYMNDSPTISKRDLK